jgi:predicted DNA-binding transcriptional regulator AlpA
MSIGARVLDTAGVSGRTGVSVSTLEKWRVAGIGPRFLKLGRLVRYAEADIESWLASRRVASTSEQLGR